MNTVASNVASDLIDALAGLPVGSPLALLRSERPEVKSATQGSFDALFELDDVQGLTLIERHAVALRVATLQGSSVLTQFHHTRLQGLNAPQDVASAATAAPGLEWDSTSWRWQAIAAFVDRLSLTPFEAEASHLAPLLAVGLSASDTVTLAQLIAFVSYQTRLLAGLTALAVHPTPLPVASATAHVPTNELLPGHHGKVEHHHPQVAYTTEVLEWASWLPIVDPAHATPDQIAVLDESHSSARSSPYYLTLVHNPLVLRQRSRLFNAIMYGQGGLSRAERELTTVAVSLVNGCPYCASVHARFFVQLAKQPQVIEALYRDGVDTPLVLRQRALIDLGVELSATPPELSANTLDTLRVSGLNEWQILDAIHAAAIFAW
ncbi:CMD domain protein, partial [Rhodoferax sp.]|uniref:CMD domain protein n=1 Tax=Rhodoferax sp. TaxID=50421 RepID=UPI0026126C14